MEAHKRPANCPMMIVSTVNKEIWSQLPQAVCPTDLRAMHIQCAMTKAATAVVELVNEILPHPRMQECVCKGTGMIRLLGHASHVMPLCRHSSLKPFVNKTVTHMCGEV